MNIAQTRQVMAYLWATHPSAPKYTDDDKARTIASYFRILYKFDINDVLEAVDRVCRDDVSWDELATYPAENLGQLVGMFDASHIVPISTVCTLSAWEILALMEYAQLDDAAQFEAQTARFRG